MVTHVQEARRAIRNLLAQWEQGLKDIGLWDKACETENCLIDLEVAIEKESEKEKI